MQRSCLHRQHQHFTWRGKHMKTDLQLQRDVLDELRFEPSIRETELGVAVKDGVVTLSGFVDSHAEKFSAERTAERVNGVRAVADEVKVKLPGAYKRSDTEIAHAAVNALRWDIQVPDDRIKATVDDGWIHLDGDVEWQYQKWAAEGAVRNLTGVKGVTNLIRVKPRKVSTYEVSQKIKESLRRHAERQDAERAAWQAPGVTMVDDFIAVAY